MGTLFSCCAEEDAAAHRTKLREITQQSSSYLPQGSQVPLLAVGVRKWRELVACDAAHVGGAELRFRKLVAKCAAANHCYYLDQGPCEATSADNIKWVTAANPAHLVDAARDLLLQAYLMDFSNNMSSNEALLGVYGIPSATLGTGSSQCPFQGFQLFCVLHFGDSSVTIAETASVVSGNAASEAAAVLSPLLRQEEHADGSVVLSDALLQNASMQQHKLQRMKLVEVEERLAFHATGCKWLRWNVLESGSPVNIWRSPTPTHAIGVSSGKSTSTHGLESATMTVVESLAGGDEYGDAYSPSKGNTTKPVVSSDRPQVVYVGSSNTAALPELIEVEELES